MEARFETAVGTTAGHKHRRGLLKSNQDDVLRGISDFLTLTVSDGVSAACRSHVGSALLVDWFTQLTQAYAATGKEFDDDTWADIAAEIADRIRINTSWSTFNPQDAIARYWAATVGGIVAGPEVTYFAGFGDLRFVVNGELISLATANEDDNQPACPAYLIGDYDVPPEELQFKWFSMPTDEIHQAMVATDGLDHLLTAQGKLIPGTTQRIPGISYLWEEDGFFSDHAALNKWLDYLARDIRKRGNVLSGGKLFDDIALGVMRRKPIMEVST